MNILIAPDSFKGTLSAGEVCRVVADTLRLRYPGVAVTEIPIADGGEGTAQAYLHIFGGERRTVCAHSPLGRMIEAAYALLPDGTAVIETAAASGITIEPVNDAMRASTFGTGELIKDALDRGCKKILLGLGGSATTDGGTGCARALGARFFDESGNDIPDGGVGLSALKRADFSALDPRLQKITLTVLCDVTNPLFGKNGAAHVYARQKGADDEQTRIPARVAEDAARIAEARRKLARESGREPTEGEIAGMLGMDEDTVGEILGLTGDISPSGQPGGDGADHSVPAELRSVREILKITMNTLPPREQALIRRRFGLDGEPPASMEEVTREFGISREEVRQIERKALRRVPPDRSDGPKAFPGDTD